jgi:uncharacterized protein (TIGR02246 family)
MKSRLVLACLAAAACLALGFALTRTNNAASYDTSVNAKADRDDKSVKARAGKAHGEEETAIRKASAAYYAAYAKGDVDAVLAFWTPDAEFIDDDGKAYRGRKALAPLFKKHLPSFKGYKITCELTSVNFVKPDVALVEGVETFKPPRGEPDISRFTAVLVKDGGKWRIRSAHDLTPEASGGTMAGRWLRELDWLVGDWVSEGKDSSVHLQVSWALNKAFLLQKYDVKRKHGADSKVIQLLGWDPATEQIKSWVFDDQGGYGEALWTRSGNNWTSEAIGVLPEGGTGSAVNLLKYRDDHTFDWQSLRREADGQPLPDIEAKFTRRTSKSPAPTEVDHEASK